jgi:HSP20 family protein
MKLTRRNNNHSEKSGWEEYNLSSSDMFDDFFTRDFFKPSFGNTGVTTPTVNIIETSDEFRLEMVAPGMNKDAFNVQLEENVITVSYDHEDNREGERKNIKYVIREYNYHSFSRSFSLPDTADAEKIQASYKDGILNIRIPKRGATQGRQIGIS